MADFGYQDYMDAIVRVVVERLDPTLESASISADTKLVGSGLAFDSMAMLELVTGLEDDLDIMIDESKFDRDVFESVDSLARFLCENVS